jgi:hypothetical protein
LESNNPLQNVDHVRAGVLEGGLPAVTLSWPSGHKGRQINMVGVLQEVLGVEEGALPLLAGSVGKGDA